LISHREPDAAGHGFTDVDVGDRPGREGADHRDLIDGRFCDLLPAPFCRDQRPADRRDGRQIRELAQDMVEGVQAVSDRDREQVGSVVRVQHVDVGLDDDVARDRDSDHRRRQDLADIAIAEQVPDEFDRRGVAGLQPDDGAHPLRGGQGRHRSRLLDVRGQAATRSRRPCRPQARPIRALDGAGP